MLENMSGHNSDKKDARNPIELDELSIYFLSLFAMDSNYDTSIFGRLIERITHAFGMSPAFLDWFPDLPIFDGEFADFQEEEVSRFNACFIIGRSGW